MALCRICSTQHYRQTEYEPEEPCLCGHGVYRDSPWSYAGWRGVAAWMKYTAARKAFESIAEPMSRWLFTPWDF